MWADMDAQQAIERLYRGAEPTREMLHTVLSGRSEETARYAAALASEIRDRVYGRRVFIRGLIEFTSFCRNDCYYCGLRRGNGRAERYRLSEAQILEACETGFSLGFRTFVLQGGEDPYFTDERLCGIVRHIKSAFPEAAVTLSVGERSEESYAMLRAAGTDRYLLRHETANEAHYAKLHPSEMQLSKRIACLETLKKLGFQTGAGMMIGSPGQTEETLIDDLLFLYRLKPEMVGTGPFIPHHDTPFRDEQAGSAELTLYLLSLVRILLPEVLLPATTALGTISGDGRTRGVLAGANVVMPNLSPEDVRKKYMLYDNKACTGLEAAEHLNALRKEMKAIGFSISAERGDHRGYQAASKRCGLQ